MYGERLGCGWQKSSAPGEVQKQLLEDTFQERNIFTAVQLPFDFKDTERSPRETLVRTLAEVEFFSPSVNRRIDVSEIPLIGGNLTIGLHVPLASKQVKLLLGKSGINDSQWDTVECRVPCSKEWIFPSG